MEENERFWPRHQDKRSSQSTPREKQNKSPAAGTKENKLAVNANTSNGKLEVAYANTWEQPNHLHNDYTVEVNKSAKAEGGLGNRRWIMGKRPDVQCLSEQFDEPNTFWKCAFCFKELDTLVA